MATDGLESAAVHFAPQTREEGENTMPQTSTSWRLSDMHTPTSDERRQDARKLANLLAPDAASALVPLGMTADRLREPKPHPSGGTYLGPVPVLVPLLDPLLGRFGRLRVQTSLPELTTDPDDGYLTIQWDDRAHLHAALHVAHTNTLDDCGDVVAAIESRAGYNGLDSWHSPLLISAVRHTFSDGTPPQTRWMTIDGSSRVWAMRAVLAARFSWLTDHPYRNPTADWNADPMVTWRTFLGALREHEQTVVPEQFTSATFVKDWADVLIPPARTENASFDVDLEVAMLLAHRAES